MTEHRTAVKSAELNQMRKRGHIWAAMVVLSVGSLALFLIMSFYITKGSAHIPISEVWNAFFNFDSGNLSHLIVRDLRLPRAISAALVGAAFAVAGAMMQGTTRNPLADSGLLGLNAGAALAISLCYSFMPGLSFTQVTLAAFLGAAFGAILVNGAASFGRGGASPVRLVLAGAAISLFLSSLSQGIALYFNVAQDAMFWTVGGVVGSDWNQVMVIAPVILIALFFAVALSRSISVMSLGDDVAKGLGLNTVTIGLFCSVIIVVLAGVSVAVVGMVGFVGLVVPHLARYVVGVDYRLIIPCSAILGAILVLTADLLARNLNPPSEIPLGALIALIGVPFFLYLARKQRRAA